MIHEWTYDAMCYDLLNMEGNKYVYVYVLEAHDPVWLELRDLHFSEASN